MSPFKSFPGTDKYTERTTVKKFDRCKFLYFAGATDTFSLSSTVKTYPQVSRQGNSFSELHCLDAAVRSAELILLDIPGLF